MKYLIVFAMSIFSLQALPPQQIISPCANGRTQSVTIIDSDQDGEYDVVHFVDCGGKESFSTLGLISPSQETDFTGSDSVDVEINENPIGDIYINVVVYDIGIPRLRIEKDYTDSNVTFTTLGGTSNKQIQVNEDQLSLLIYPNPSFNKITLQNLPPNAKFVKIFNLNGEKLRSANLNGEKIFELDITELSIGLYYIQIGNVEYSQLYKITKIN